MERRILKVTGGLEHWSGQSRVSVKQESWEKINFEDFPYKTRKKYEAIMVTNNASSVLSLDFWMKGLFFSIIANKYDFNLIK